jgi:hypothetical protein
MRDLCARVSAVALKVKASGLTSFTSPESDEI